MTTNTIAEEVVKYCDSISALTVDQENLDCNVVTNEGVWEQFEESLQGTADSHLTVVQAEEIHIAVCRERERKCLVCLAYSIH